ncbi:hypothetical protein PDIG_08670 [Penicillium digitatum PHI26]|uniref:Uncharacterized protein n=2 Tax=Penicillium digitatum TaxID=36651 RepID=K9GVA0_PEND2|nr:hypothetical protein PDIP_36690 [Penicillium digitatum Pd1]EKV16336.1 hypothetical protein PDIP_36690 [Penicillium digitatum Pd1]EKV18553.1 hypothetical protein PDIG_08670 [Penicillium digitatum PHI26]
MLLHIWTKTRCPRCMPHHTLGHSSEPHEGLVLIPKGLPSMFALNDGLCPLLNQCSYR